ncbi:MAG TPA: inositol monophosphatase family protein [Allosphingosinicella sp.]|nr:inositol monophosphatase family protein [Allosphingosinicella sp.]
MADDLETFADFARDLARAARLETLAGCRSGLDGVENKLEAGFDPVTEYDRNSEVAMRRLIESRFPGHGISGEELADRAAEGRWSWSLDPIDGTRAYICGLPSWTTLIALLDDGEPVLGAVDVPRLDELYLGDSSGARMFGVGEERRLAVSGCRTIAEARLSTTDPYLFEGAEAEGFERLRRSARLTRYGLDAYAYALVAAGSLDLVAESGLKPHDYNALVPLVRAAGGAVSNWSGGSDLGAGQIVAAANEALLEEACRLLGG